MIPVEWLSERLHETNPDEVARRELQELAIDSPAQASIFASPAIARWRQNWVAFLSQMAPGDELWRFTSPPEAWQSLAGVAGYAIVRDRKPTHVLTSRRS